MKQATFLSMLLGLVKTIRIQAKVTRNVKLFVYIVQVLFHNIWKLTGIIHHTLTNSSCILFRLIGNKEFTILA